jgi:ribosomal protein S17E
MAVTHVLEMFRNDFSHNKRVVAVLQYIISGDP